MNFMPSELKSQSLNGLSIQYQVVENGELRLTVRGPTPLAFWQGRGLILLAQKREKEASRTVLNSLEALRRLLFIPDAGEQLTILSITDGSKTNSRRRYFQYLQMEATTGRIVRGMLWNNM